MYTGYHRKAIVWILFAAVLLGCGGGGSDGGDVVSSQQSSTPTISQKLSPTWSLQRATPPQLGSTQVDVDAILNHIFEDQAVQSATLVKEGYIIGERFSSGISADSLGTSWSMAKSFYAAAIGVAIADDWILSLDQPASDFLTEWIGTNKEAITIRNILEMRAGFPDDSTIYFADEHTQFALNLEKTTAAGTDFIYSNPTSQLFEPLLLRATGLDAHSFLRQKILRPIGIDTNLIGMWSDRTGRNPITYFGLDMRPSDFARFGLLFARDGEWEGQQIVARDYVISSLQAQSAFYGFQWWVLNDSYFGKKTPITVAAALGWDGQKIYVWADQDIVLVVQTKYQHNPNQGYTLSNTNFPDTCSVRNSCPGASGAEEPSYNEFALMLLLERLAD